MSVGAFVERVPSLLQAEVGCRAPDLIELESTFATLQFHEPQETSSVLLGVLDVWLWRLDARSEFSGASFATSTLVEIWWDGRRNVTRT
jgi:hypothetical protein